MEVFAEGVRRKIRAILEEARRLNEMYKLRMAMRIDEEIRPYFDEISRKWGFDLSQTSGKSDKANQSDHQTRS